VYSRWRLLLREAEKSTIIPRAAGTSRRESPADQDSEYFYSLIQYRNFQEPPRGLGRADDARPAHRE